MVEAFSRVLRRLHSRRRIFHVGWFYEPTKPGLTQAGSNNRDVKRCLVYLHGLKVVARIDLVRSRCGSRIATI